MGRIHPTEQACGGGHGGQVGAQVVAEMIETEEEAALMRELGVQFGQGWLFGRPGTLPGARR